MLRKPGFIAHTNKSALQPNTMIKRLRTSLTGWRATAEEPQEPDEQPEPPAEEQAEEEDDSNDPFRKYGNRSVAVWDAATCTSSVIRQKGKHFRIMGCFERGAVKLFAEETLYLVEREALVLLPSAPVEDEEHPDPITARECYDLCLRNEDQNDGQRCPLACYWTYQQLKGLGYVVCRPQQYAVADGSRAIAPQFWAGDVSPGAPEVPVCFECHQPSQNFAKSRLGDPAFRVFVTHAGGGLPSVTQLTDLLERCAGAPAKAAVAAGDGTVLLFDLTEGVPTIA